MKHHARAGRFAEVEAELRRLDLAFTDKHPRARRPTLVHSSEADMSSGRRRFCFPKARSHKVKGPLHLGMETNASWIRIVASVAIVMGKCVRVESGG